MEYYKSSYGDLMNETLDIIRFPELYDHNQLKEECDSSFYNELIHNKIPKMSSRCPNSDIYCEVFQTETMGRGIRAKVFIPRGTTVGCYLGILKHVNDRQSTDEWRYDFAFTFNKFFIDGSNIKSLMSLVNHSHNNNIVAEYRLHNTEYMEECHIAFIATTDITHGEELFIDYGNEYWKYYEKQKNILPIDKNQPLITDYFEKK